MISLYVTKFIDKVISLHGGPLNNSQTFTDRGLNVSGNGL